MSLQHPIAPARPLAGQLAVVTGGAGGIGLGTARALATLGVRTVLADIDGDSARAAANAIKADFDVLAVAAVIDVADTDAMLCLAEDVDVRHGPVHLLFNNAGVMPYGPILQHSVSDWRWLFDVNVIGVVNGINAFVPRMLAHGEPCRVANTASMAAFAPSDAFPSYAASKQAVLGLTEALRNELKDTAVSVSVVCPGAVNTKIGLSERNRQQRYGPPSARSMPSGPEQDKAALQMIDPAEAGRRIVAGFQRDDFWIFTHPEWTRRIVTRFNEAYDAGQAAVARRSGEGNRDARTGPDKGRRRA